MWLGLSLVYVDTVYGFYGYSVLCLDGCFSMIIWTPTVLSVLYACVSYFCISICSPQMSMFHMERRSRNTLIIIIISSSSSNVYRTEVSVPPASMPAQMAQKSDRQLLETNLSEPLFGYHP